MAFHEWTATDRKTSLVSQPHAPPRRISVALQALLIFLTLLPGLLAFANEGDSVRIQLKWHHQFQFAGYYAAAEKGYYQENGFKPILLEGAPNLDPVAEVLAGHAEYGVSDTSLLIERAKGKKVVVLAAVFQHSPLVFVTRAKSGIRSFADLKGRSISLRPEMDVELVASLKLKGVDLPDCRIVPYDRGWRALLDAGVEAAAAYRTDIVSHGMIPREFVLLDSADEGFDFFGDCLFTTEAEARDNPARVRAVVDATLHGWRWAEENPDGAIALIRAHYLCEKSDEELNYEARVTLDLIQKDLVHIGHMDLGRWEKIREAYSDLGLIPKGTSLEGFLYEQPQPSHPPWIHPLLWVLATLTAVGLLWTITVMVFNRKLRKALDCRTHELDRFFQLNLDLLCVMSLDGRFVRLNPEWERTLGHTLDELKAHPLFDFVHPNDLEATRAVFQELRAGNPVLNFLHQCRDKSGGYRYLEWRAAPEGGLIYAATRDVTPQIEALRNWSESEARWRAIVEKEPECVKLLDREGRILEMNPSGLEMIEATSLKQVRGKQARILVVEEDRAAFDEMVAATFRGEERQLAFGVIGLKGGRRTLETHSVLLRDGDPNNPVLTLLGVTRDITERLAAEETLRMSEERYRALFSASPEAIVVTSQDEGIILAANTAFLEITGYSSQETLGQKTVKLGLWADSEARERTIGAARGGKIVRNQETVIRRKSGEPVLTLFSLAPIILGETDCFLSIWTDITERKKMEEQLIVIGKAVESASDAIGISDAQGHHFYQNRALSDLFGYASAEELEAAGGGPAVVKSPEVAQEMFDNIMSGKSWTGELEMVTKDGRVFPAYERADAIKDKTGKIVGLIGIITDITERKRAEQALREQEARYRVLFEQSGDYILMFRLDEDEIPILMEANEAAVLAHGYSREELLGKPITLLDSGSTPEDHRMRAGAIARGDLALFSVQHRRKDGSLFDVEVRAQALQTGAGRFIVTSERDITERKRAEESLRASLREKETLLKEIHHRVKNNLQIISSLLNLQARDLPEGVGADPLAESQGRVRAMALVHEMLYRSEDLARVDAGAFVRELVATLLQSSFGSTDRPQLILEVEPILLGTDQMVPLGLLLNELLTNAFKYGKRPGHPGTIRVALRRQGAEEIFLSVSDSGDGISENALQGERQTLGMRLVSSLAGQLQGTLRYEHAAGTTATLTFPFEEKNGSSPGKEAAP